MDSPKVSIIMPSLNVVDYIRECMDSVLRQTLKEIEIICVDACSTDGTLEILREYEASDARIRVITSPIKSYGYQMNLGLDMARGKYIGIVETDDWAEDNMFETLYATAERTHADVVRSNYYWHTAVPKRQSVFFENHYRCKYNVLFSPLEYHSIFSVAPSIWSGIYRRSMLVKNHIRFNETPGASYQDTSFHFMVCTVAESVYLLKNAFIHYRMDNPNSSVKSDQKVFCISDEMHYYEAFLNTKPEHKKKIELHYIPIKFDLYLWNYQRIRPTRQWEFMNLMREEFIEHQKDGLLQKKLFFKNEWYDLQLLISDPERFFNETRTEGNRKRRTVYESLTRLPRTVRAVVQCYKEQGLTYTIRHARERILSYKD